MDELLFKGQGKRLLVLKHSTACPISGMARREVENYLEDHPEAVAVLLVVQQQRALSDQIAARFNVRHETPQLLVIEDGRAWYVRSHFNINREELERKLE